MSDPIAKARARCDKQTGPTQSSGQGLEREVDALISATLRHHMLNPKLAQAFEHIEDQLPMDTEIAQLKQNMARLVVDALARYGINDPEATAFDLVAIGHGMSHAAIAAGHQDFDNLHRRIRRAVPRYLQQAPSD